MTEVTLQVESNELAPSVSRSSLSEIRPALGHRYDDVLLLVSELVTNSVRHSGTSNVDVSVQAEDGVIRVEVSDDGPGFDPRRPRGDGMGLMLVEKLSESWGLQDGDRFTVWAELAND